MAECYCGACHIFEDDLDELNERSRCGGSLPRRVVRALLQFRDQVKFAPKLFPCVWKFFVTFSDRLKDSGLVSASISLSRPKNLEGIKWSTLLNCQNRQSLCMLSGFG
jgi:hypothetical protein